MASRRQPRTIEAEHQLRSCLSFGCYEPGADLTLVKLSTELKVSPKAVQKLVGPLVREGLLQKMPGHRSVTVPTQPVQPEGVRVPCPHRAPAPYPQHVGDEAVRRLRQRIASCCYQPGDVVTRDRLARDLGIPLECAQMAFERVAQDGDVEWFPAQLAARVPHRHISSGPRSSPHRPSTDVPSQAAPSAI